MKKQHNVIYTWNDVTISQFDGIVKALGQDGADDIDRLIGVLSVMTGEKPEHYYRIPVAELNGEIARVSFIKDEPKPAPVKTSYRIGGSTYRLTVSAGKMTAGQYIDYTTTLREEPGNTAMLMAILLVQKGKKYGEGYDVSELSEKIRDNFRYVDAAGIAFFFSLLLKSCTIAMLRCSQRELRKQMKRETDTEKRTMIYGAVGKIQEQLDGLRSSKQ